MAKRSVSRAEREKLFKEINVQIIDDPAVPIGTKRVAEQVRDYWANVAWPEVGVKGKHAFHFYETGGYRESIKVKQNRSPRTGRFKKFWTVYTNHHDANFIEFGTKRDKPGSRSPWGPYTPTPEFAPAALTAIRFRGTAP